MAAPMQVDEAVPGDSSECFVNPRQRERVVADGAVDGKLIADEPGVVADLCFQRVSTLVNCKLSGTPHWSWADQADTFSDMKVS